MERFNAWKGDGKKRPEGERGKDEGYDIWRGADDKNGEWAISVPVPWRRRQWKSSGRGRGGVETKGLRVNMEKTKVVISGEEPMIRMENGRYPCGCYGRGWERIV